MADDSHVQELTSKLVQASSAFSSGSFDEAQALLEEVRGAASPDSVEHGEADLLLHHLGNIGLLTDIARATELRRCRDLIGQAEEKGLNLDVELRPLSELKERVLARIQDEVDDQARDYLSEGDLALHQNEFEEARTSYEAAQRIQGLSSELEMEIEEHLAKLDEAIRAEELIAEARSLKDASKYAEAAERLQEASELRPDHPGLPTLLGDVEELAEQERQVTGLLAQAAEALDDNPRQAKLLYEDAESLAEEKGLVDYAEQAAEGGEIAAQEVKEREERSRVLTEEGNEARAEGDFTAAIEEYEEATKLNPENEEAADALASAKEFLGRKEEAEELKQRGERLWGTGDYDAALESLRRAKELNPEDSELDGLVKQVEKAEARDMAVAFTIWLGLSPHETPLGLDTELDELRGDLMGARLRDMITKVRRLFRREAVAKLRAFLQRAWDHIEAGEFDQAEEVYAKADEEWGTYYNEEEEKSQLGALRARLEIVRQQRDDLRTAGEAYSGLEPALGGAVHAFGDRRYWEALEAYQDIWLQVPELPRGVQYMLGDRRDRPGDEEATGVMGEFHRNLAVTARRCGMQSDPLLADQVGRIESKLDLGRLDEAEELLDGNLQEARRLKDAWDVFEQVAPPDWRELWTARPWWKTLDDLVKRLEQERTKREKLDEARDIIGTGDLTLKIADAEARFGEVLDLEPESREAQDGLELVERLKPKVEDVADAEREGRIEGQWDCLTGILKVAPQSKWARAQQEKLRPILNRRRDIQSRLNEISRSIQTRDFEWAKREVDEVLTGLPADEAWASDLVADSRALMRKAEEGEEGIQRIEKLCEDAEQALGAGDFETAEQVAQQVLEESPGEPRAQRVQEKASEILGLIEEARKRLGEQKPQEAENLLNQARWLAQVESEVVTELLGEARQEAAKQLGLKGLLRDARKADKGSDWKTALGKATQALNMRPTKAAEADLFEIRDRAIAGLKESIQDDLDAGVESKLPQAREGWQALRDNGVDDPVFWELERKLKRASILASARKAIEIGTPEHLDKAVGQLEALMEEWAGDEETEELDKNARFALLVYQAKTLERRGDAGAVADALGKLEEAIRLRPDQPEVLESLGRLRVTHALLQAEQFIEAGELGQARVELEGVSEPDDPRVGKLLSEIGELDEWLGGVDPLCEQGEVAKAVALLDKVLHKRPNLPLALSRKKSIIEELLEQGRKAQIDGDWWRARELYEILEKISPSTPTDLSAVRRECDNLIKDLYFRISKALRNPNVRVDECDELSDQLGEVMATHVAPPARLRKNVPALERLKEQVTQVDELVARARTELRQAHETGNYKAVHNTSERIHQVDPLFNERDEVRTLDQERKKHSAKYEQVKQQGRLYGEAVQELAQEVVLTVTGHPDSVRDLLHKGREAIKRAMRLNRGIKELDPENLYKFEWRQWPDPSAEDPLDKKHRDLSQQLQNLDLMGNGVLRALEGRDQGHRKLDRAQERYESRERNEDYEEAQELWAGAAEDYGGAVAQLERAAGQEGSTPWARELAESARRLLREITQKQDEAAGQAGKTAIELAEIEAWYEEAKEAFDNRDWGTAIDRSDLVLDRCPRHTAARKLKATAERLEREEKERKQRVIMGAVAGGVTFIVILALAWFFGLGPGRRLIWPPTPTPTPPVIVVPSPTPLSTVTPPTRPTHTPGPSTTTPVFEPRACRVIEEAWVRQGPSANTIGLERLAEGAEVGAIDILESEEGRWYRITGYDTHAYIHESLVDCAEP